MSASSSGLKAKLLNPSYFASGEAILRETRGTKLYYFPGPVVALLLGVFFDVAALGTRSPGSFAGIPYLTPAIGRFPQVGQYAPSSYVTTIFVLLTLVALVWLLVRYLRWISTVYAVTSSRIIIKHGILSRDFDEIPIPQVRGIDVHQSVGQRMLGYGTLSVSSEGGTKSGLGNEVWHGIPKPFEFQRLVEGATQNLARNVGSGAYGAGGQDPSRYMRPPGMS